MKILKEKDLVIPKHQHLKIHKAQKIKIINLIKNKKKKKTYKQN